MQGGEACPAGAKHMRGRTFCRLLASVAFFESRSLGEGSGEGGPGTNIIEHYACRAVPRRSEAKAGVQS